MTTLRDASRPAFCGPWWLVLCLVGLDYFSSLSYLPALLVQATGSIAPLAALVVVIVTLGVALPVYWYVVGHSPDGRGGTGVIERLVPGWRGKLLILLLLSFVATDYVVTQSLSIADAAEHLRANPHFQKHVDPILDRWVPADWLSHPLWKRACAGLTHQIVITVILSLSSFALWAYWHRGSPARFLRVAAVVVLAYLVVNGIVIVSGMAYLTRDGQALSKAWAESVMQQAFDRSGATTALNLLALGLAAFPFAALGLSGFELSMAVAPMIDGGDTDTTSHAGRIRGMRCLLVTATLLMSALLFGSVTVSTQLIPHTAFHNHGAAVHRALAYLAHGGELADGRPATAINSLFGLGFGTVYDAVSIAMLCLAGACVLIALRDYVPEYLHRFGMELDLAHKLGVKMQFFNLIMLLVTVLFHADIARMQWAYVTSMLALLTGGAFAALLAVQHTHASSRFRVLWSFPALCAFAFFLAMGLLAAGISRSGLEIAVTFAAGILLTSALSRWIRSTELRVEGFDFVDDDSRQRWERCCSYHFHILVPHRPGLHSRRDKESLIRRRHRLGADTPIVLIEATVGDPSEFYQRPVLRVTRENGAELIQATGCASVAHVLAAMAIEMSRTGEPAELHFGWSNESPFSANLNFLLFGEGNIPWLVRELIAKAEPDIDRRPLVILG